MPRDNNTMTAQDLANKLGGKRSGRGWRCPCPAHDDHEPSLDVTEGQDGKILVTCRAGCDQATVIDALRSRGVWDGGSGNVNGAASRPAAEEAVLVDVVPAGAPDLDMRAVLRTARILQRRGDSDIFVVDGTDYTVADVVRFDVKDRKGRHLYSEARILFGWQERKGRSDKTHRPVTLWRRPDGQLEWRAKGYRKPGPLYGLETLDGNPDAAVVVYEGPGKSDRARELAPSRIHLSLMGGAAKSDHTDVSDLKGRDVVLWFDADEAGEKATAALRAWIAKAGARTIGTVTPPAGVPKGWGIDDLENQEAAGDDVEALIAAALDGAEPAAANHANHDANCCQPPPTDSLLLSLDDWLSAEIAPPDFLIGEVFHSESRAYLIGPTGLGKTNFSMALAAAMAAGTDFLHWKGSGKPRRVLYVDGEMGERLMRQRIEDVVRRHGSKPDGLTVLCRANLERRGINMPPLNTREGQQFIESIIERLGGVDFIVFDNLQALVTGSLREEDAFAAVLTWAKTLTGRSIGQIWVHHTGIDESRGYGDKSKEWQFDTVLLLKRVGEDGEVLFDLEFKKARERTPDNRADYAPIRVELVDDRWESSTEQGTPVGKRKPLVPSYQSALDELANVLITKGRSVTHSEIPPGVTCVTLDEWRAQAKSGGLIEETSAGRAFWYRTRITLKGKHIIGIRGDWVWLVRP
jgi:hypothetical protein